MKQNECAVSPVIGVMLMIVVTIIIAAIVSAFAGDMSGGQTTTPVASIQCSIVKPDAHNATLTMTHLSGDPINTRDMRIIVSYKDANGNPKQTRTSGSSVSILNSDDETVSVKVPYLADPKVGSLDSTGDELTAINYGKYVWNIGQVVTTGNAAGFTAIFGVDPSTDPSGVNIGDTFNIKLVDINSQKAIFEKDVSVR
ncbi:MAG: type IV pilin [Methanoregula sp.]|jgi:FlaG/FlaF family flagellin (archaellin)|uniref:type IV pilin N-terminal domain-containing protein n=1 Tax=Methanoregula sp. TaxID=2052170 RepID=UPI0025E7C585|nr:type IV pilin [Methanoregula sp.]MCK9632668.1 type IV pilin [Methanoregula sp.]